MVGAPVQLENSVLCAPGSKPLPVGTTHNVPRSATIPHARALTTLCMVQQKQHEMGALTPAVLSRLAKELKELTRQPCEGIRVGVELLLQHRLHMAASRPAAV